MPVPEVDRERQVVVIPLAEQLMPQPLPRFGWVVVFLPGVIAEIIHQQVNKTETCFSLSAANRNAISYGFSG